MKTISIIKFAFVTIGLIFIALALYLYQDKQVFLKKAEITQGIVIQLLSSRSENSITYHPVIVFVTKTGNKISFASSVSSNPPSYNEGESVEVIYDSDNPNKAEINSFTSLYLGIIILGSLGTIFFLGGFMIILFGYLKQKKSQHLLHNGKRISTKFENIQLNYGFAVNGRNPFQIHSRWLDPSSNELYIFKSDNIWFDPTDFVKTEEIIVMIDSNNPKNYFMNVSFLPKLNN